MTDVFGAGGLSMFLATAMPCSAAFVRCSMRMSTP